MNGDKTLVDLNDRRLSVSQAVEFNARAAGEWQRRVAAAWDAVQRADAALSAARQDFARVQAWANQAVLGPNIVRDDGFTETRRYRVIEADRKVGAASAVLEAARRDLFEARLERPRVINLLDPSVVVQPAPPPDPRPQGWPPLEPWGRIYQPRPHR